jgi:hypothetical protein
MSNPARLELVTYFDSLISQVDLNTEILLFSDHFEQSELERINERRNFLIKEIKTIEAFNLKHLKDGERDKETIFKKFCFVFSESDLSIDNIDKTSLDVSKFGYLIITDVFLSPENLACFKEMLKWSYKPQKLDDDNLFFALKEPNPKTEVFKHFFKLCFSKTFFNLILHLKENRIVDNNYSQEDPGDRFCSRDNT